MSHCCSRTWDIGSARFPRHVRGLATTISGFAATLGRRNYRVTRDEALADAQSLVEATDVPVSADLENCFAHDPAGVADTIERAIATGLADADQDFTGDARTPSTCSTSPPTASPPRRRRPTQAETSCSRGSENFLHGRQDLTDTILRLQRFQEAGADVLYAPALVSLDDIRSVVSSVDRPVNVLTVPGLPSVAELGVGRSRPHLRRRRVRVRGPRCCCGGGS